MTDAQSEDLPALMLESVDPEAVGVDVESGTISTLLRRCLQVLTQIAADPGRTALVITGDFTESVRGRLGEHPEAENFNLERGAGSVAGKTMPRPDGSIDVLVPWWLFDVDVDPERRLAATRLTVRTIVHESQHVAMRQNEQGYQHPVEQSWRDRNITSVADSVVDEYRAELGVGVTLPEDESSWSPLEVLRALSRALGSITASYQDHLDVQRLAFETGEACAVAWRAMAYIAAVDNQHPERSTVTPEVMADPLWERMAAASWPTFCEALSVLPPGIEVMTPPDMTAAVERLAKVFVQWLADLGFVWIGETFRIEQWYFEDEDFRLAISTIKS